MPQRVVRRQPCNVCYPPCDIGYDGGETVGMTPPLGAAVLERPSSRPLDLDRAGRV